MVTPGFLKVLSKDGEWRSGDVLEAFEGRGIVRLVARTADGLLLERLHPATPLSTLVATNDEEATTVLARVIAALAPRSIPSGTPTVADWGSSFDGYLESGDRKIPPDLVRRAQSIYLKLCDSQRDVRLLHGDLHHDNVLFDTTRGWIAVDPKGVVGELEYEVGAALRNPIELPGIFTDPTVIDTRLRILSQALHLDPARLVAWGFAQAVLATIWLAEDSELVHPDYPWLTLARILEQRIDWCPGAAQRATGNG